jgi:hypothetical protein
MSAILKEEPPELSIAQPRAAGDRSDRPPRPREDPAERFQSARDLGFALEALSGTSGSMPATVDAAPRKRRGAWSWPLRWSSPLVRLASSARAR